MNETADLPHNPILIVDDDIDDLELVKDAFSDMGLPNHLHFFNSGDVLIDYLEKCTNTPYLIICDLNMPLEDGFSIREKVLNNTSIRHKSIPFIFWSDAASDKQIQKAYDLRSQGFFIKANSFPELKHTISIILQYWNISQHPKRL